MKYMKNTLIFSIIMLVIGTCLLITGFIIEQNGSEANPMFFGLGCGLGVAGLVNTIQAIKLIKNPEKCEKILLDAMSHLKTTSIIANTMNVTRIS